MADLIQTYKTELFGTNEYYEGKLDQMENMEGQPYKGLVKRVDNKTILDGIGKLEN